MKKTIVKIIALAVAIAVAIPTYIYAADNRADQIYTICEQVGADYGISPELLQAIAYTESRYQSNAQNGECKGICQINFRVHSGRIARLGITDPWNDEAQIRLCADYIAELRDSGTYGQEISWVLDKYNGFTKADAYAISGQISDYANKVLSKAEALEREHGK